ncbi:MAG: crossover junction endodeoxyribonuclease RuvC [Acidobacteria bacterium]|nr:crossover junction endodeoxyribonuclease RuvC [Acidobacteriota bacterium]
MIVLGVDPGSRVTGLGVIDVQGNRLIHIHSEALRFPADQPIGARMVRMVDHVEKLVTTYRPQVISLEKVFHAVNVKSTLTLGYMRGAVLYQASRMGIPVAEYAATEVKVAVTGYGRAEKHQVQDMVRMLLNLAKPPKPHDISDALALAICHAHTNPAALRDL